jgi:RNA polymerase sigma-70 factor (ECF subfamily)
MSEQYSEEELIERLRAGDKAACALCVDIHSPAVYRLALRLMGNRAEAEDVVQETFMNAFKSIDGFEGRSGLGTWLYRIAHNAAMMRLRRPNPYMIPVEEADAASGYGLVPKELFDWCCLPEKDFESEEVRRHLEMAINQLPSSLKAVFTLRELEGLSTNETATVLDLSEGAVKVKLHRARLWLRERLTPYFREKVQNSQLAS